MPNNFTDAQVMNSDFHVNSPACECDFCTGKVLMHDRYDEDCECEECELCGICAVKGCKKSHFWIGDDASIRVNSFFCKTNNVWDCEKIRIRDLKERNEFIAHGLQATCRGKNGHLPRGAKLVESKASLGSLYDLTQGARLKPCNC